MRKDERYPGIHNDRYGGMTDVGRIIRDAWVFGILPEEETCENWAYSRIQEIYDKVHAAWEPYGHLVSQLPEDLRERHERIYGEGIRRARELGWEMDLSDDD